ncbi:MAG: glycosyl hydrolase family protein [Microvirga sp.]|jgi:GH15 family glucan-1,4-alpha-glucosidase|nr:glycosyl hydrolase family protein [Microvirga sp.]MCE3246345.1 glycosyl hydrolase family protein [Geminicoccaceae bacterium]MDF2969642.1 glycosyl hydrolase family protein [Microvirga sp.]
MLQVAQGERRAEFQRWTEPEIGDYAIIGDCRTAALVARAGAIDWLCLPHFSGPSVFAALIDRRRGGTFSVTPEQQFKTKRRYVGPTAVLETTFETSTGTARLVDLMPVLENPGALHPTREILRVVEGVEGEVDLQVRFEPRPNYARAKPRFSLRGVLGWACTWSDELFLLHADIALELTEDGKALIGRIRMKAGERAYLSLCYSKADIGIIAPLGEPADDRLTSTLKWWTAWSCRCAYEGPHYEAVLRSAITLKLMTFALSGAVIAAPTTSLPEAIGADRNWDYRYCWLRDAALTMRAFTGLGFHDEAASFLQWLLHATRLTWPELQVMYDVYGQTNLREEELEGLSGFRDSRPVRIGNEAHSQVQLDVYGGVVAAAFDYVESGGKLQSDEAKLLVGFGKTVCKKWREPDSGIWEIRGPKRHYTFSKVMCWTALDCLIKLHERRLVRIDVDRFREERDAIADTIERRGYSTSLGSYVSELDGDRLDAALLLMGCLGYKDPGHPRMIGTYDLIERRLGRDGLLYRYEQGYDGVPAPEGAFGICSFWVIDNLAKRGGLAAAERSFEHILSFGNDLGLFAEEIDIETGAALGNFPQAFTHVGLINAAIALASARRSNAK